MEIVCCEKSLKDHEVLHMHRNLAALLTRVAAVS